MIKNIIAILITYDNNTDQEEIYHVSKRKEDIPQLKEMIEYAKKADKKAGINARYRIEIFE